MQSALCDFRHAGGSTFADAHFLRLPMLEAFGTKPADKPRCRESPEQLRRYECRRVKEPNPCKGVAGGTSQGDRRIRERSGGGKPVGGGDVGSNRIGGCRR